MNFLYKFLIFTFLFSPFIHAQSVIQLFNGNDLKGWYAFEPETGKHIYASELFLVEDHMIRLYGDKAGYLMSNQSFSDFQLTIEFRWNTDTTFVKRSSQKNSGVMYLVPSEMADTLWPAGIQFQIKEGATGDFILLQEVNIKVKGVKTEPGTSVNSKRFVDATNPIGEWNTIVITSKNGEIKQELNGILVNAGTEASVSEGRILLQYEGFPIDFRKVQIEPYN